MTANQIAQQLLDLRGHTAADELLQDVVAGAVRYARLRVDWALTAREDRVPMAGARTAAHNALIDSCNILSRAMLRAGESNLWRESLGDDRKAIGDMACHLHCLLGLAAR